MNTVTHAASAFLIKKTFPKMPLIPLFIGVNLMDLFWILFMVVGLEKTRIASSGNDDSLSQSLAATTQSGTTTVSPDPGGIMQTTADIIFSQIPYSHSITMAIVQALLFGLLIKRYFYHKVDSIADHDDDRKILIAGFLAVVSHLVLDIIAHDSDLELIPFVELPRIGLGLYSFPVAMFVIEVLISVVCWWVYGGRKLLLVAILVFQFAQICGYIESCRFLISIVDCGIIWLPLANLVIIILASSVFYILRNKNTDLAIEEVHR